MKPQNRSSRSESIPMTVLRYILGIGVLAAVFTIAHLLLWNPNDSSQTAEQEQMQGIQNAPTQY